MFTSSIIAYRSKSLNPKKYSSVQSNVWPLPRGGANHFHSAPSRTSVLLFLNADVLLTLTLRSDKMLSFGSKLLFLFLLAFPCGLTSVGESHFFSFFRPFSNF